MRQSSLNKVEWPIVFWLVAMHVGALAAPWFFTWPAFACFVVLAFATGLGVTLGFHRLLTHDSFKTYRGIRWFLALVGTLAGQGGVLQWVADHRRHHKFADRPGDPHSPLEGFMWAHATWNFFNSPQNYIYFREYCPDLYADPVWRLLHRTHVLWHFAFAGLLYSLGGWPFIFWGMFVRLVYVLHITWFVNSAAHRWGYRNFETRDGSTNLWWVALTAFGEGWHNNHHAFPQSARHGMRRREFDLTFQVIRLMRALGLAWQVKDFSFRVRLFDKAA